MISGLRACHPHEYEGSTSDEQSWITLASECMRLASKVIGGLGIRRLHKTGFGTIGIGRLDCCVACTSLFDGSRSAKWNLVAAMGLEHHSRCKR